MLLPHTWLSRQIDPILGWLGRLTGWIWLLLLLTIVSNVTLRYVFGEGYVQLEELQWHLYATGFLLGLFYAYQADTHIRVDLLLERWSPRTRAWLELYGTLLLLFPFLALVLVHSLPFVKSSFVLGEVSQAPGGLPMRWLIKSMLPLGFTLLLLAALSRLSRVWALLFFAPEPDTLATRATPHEQ
jgi:TRAP-type mannitol/chloroaromatic compound transport system permease small subunit